MDRDTVELIFMCAVLIVGIVGACYLVWVGYNFTYVGQEYDVVVTVQAVEHSTRWGEHTNLWARVYGEQDITYTLKGYHDFKIGSTYRIKFKNENAVFGIEHWGKVISIERIENDV